MTARQTWKNYERRVALDLGGRRIPVTGIDRHGADVETRLFNIQVKLRKSLPSWLWGWLGGIVASSAGTGRIGVLILRRPRGDEGEGLVVLRYRDWVDLHGTVRYIYQPHRAASRENAKESE